MEHDPEKWEPAFGKACPAQKGDWDDGLKIHHSAPEAASAFPGLEDLVDFGHGNEIDMRPTLLRVLTDLYLQRPSHSPEDERYYTELVLRLIEATDVAARAALARRLARYRAAPRAIIERLAGDEFEVAAPILEHSPLLSRADLAALAQERGGAHAAQIAKRLASPMEPPVSAADERAQAEAGELTELFYAAGAPERRLILISLDYAVITPERPLALMQRADVWRLEGAALQRNSEVVIREFERTLGLSRARVRRIMEDELGEPIVVAAKALDLPGDAVQRMLLFVNPKIGQSVDRVYELADLYAEISVSAARRLVAIWRKAAGHEDRERRHDTVAWRAAAENARRALSEVSRRPALLQESRLRSRAR
jgi:hypothetical protein